MPENEPATLHPCNKCGGPTDTPFCGYCGANQRDPGEVALIAFHTSAEARARASVKEANAFAGDNKGDARIVARLQAAAARYITLSVLLAEVGRPIAPLDVEIGD